jgi:hypothetical protein
MTIHADAFPTHGHLKFPTHGHLLKRFITEAQIAHSPSRRDELPKETFVQSSHAWSLFPISLAMERNVMAVTTRPSPSGLAGGIIGSRNQRAKRHIFVSYFKGYITLINGGTFYAFSGMAC